VSRMLSVEAESLPRASRVERPRPVAGHAERALADRPDGTHRVLTRHALSVLQLQAGNRAVQRLFADASAGLAGATVQRCGPTPCDCPPEEKAAAEQKSAAATLVTGEGGDQETETVTRTADGMDAGAGPSDGGLPPGGAPPACKSVSGTANLPSGTLPATLSGNKLGASWSMSADFTSDPADPAVCGPCGEYRQYVRGTFTKNGRTVTHRLCGTDLDPTTFQEDCAQIGSTQYKYGYHSIPFANSRFSRPDQATGQRWDGRDAPGITGSSGDTLGVNLDFQGSVIDTCNGATLGGSTWSVSGTAPCRRRRR